MASPQQLYDKYSNLATMAAKNGGNADTYNKMASNTGYKPPEVPKNPIAQAVANPPAVKAPEAQAVVTPPKETPAAVDNSGMINSSYDNIASALRAKIQQSINDKNASITKLPEKYQSDRNTSAVATDQQVHTLNEMAANSGDRGGIGRQNTLNAMVGGENRINAITMAQKAEEAQLRNDIANLTLEGNVQEAQTQAAKLKDLIANNTSMDNTNYERGFNAETMANNQNNLSRTFNENLRQFNVTSKTNQDNTDRTYKLGLAQDVGKTFDANGNLVDSAATVRQREQDIQTKADKEKKDYLDSIRGLGEQFDYAAAIDSIVKDGDTSNDWKIPYLKQEREVKVQNRLQNEVATISQYSKDYQAEINKRDLNDPLLPYLKTAQLQKIAAIGNAKVTAQEAQQKQAMDIWVKMGVASPEVAAILGIPEGAQTSDYGVDQANINQSNASATASIASANRKDSTEKLTKEDLNGSFGEDYGAIKNLSYADAYNELKNGAKDYIAQYGYDGYKKLYNSVLNDVFYDPAFDYIKPLE